ncbi:unnamed protein product [Allacma fusca]|uniref:Uncharacterized protein n=1 Tax=Allacma fusca TaxID=39272 RepID=A0A8J2JQM3_9HEXA|nr:unnamed protein product [Allacma fusca]
MELRVMGVRTVFNPEGAHGTAMAHVLTHIQAVCPLTERLTMTCLHSRENQMVNIWRKLEKVDEGPEKVGEIWRKQSTFPVGKRAGESLHDAFPDVSRAKIFEITTTPLSYCSTALRTTRIYQVEDLYRPKHNQH